jgi:hypothetical protein
VFNLSLRSPPLQPYVQLEKSVFIELARANVPCSEVTRDTSQLAKSGVIAAAPLKVLRRLVTAVVFHLSRPSPEKTAAFTFWGFELLWNDPSSFRDVEKAK